MNLPADAPAPAPPVPLSGDWIDWRDPAYWPDLTKIVTENDTPVDNPLTEKQMRLLTEPL